MRQTLPLLLALAAWCLADDMHIIRIDHMDRDLHPDLLERLGSCEVLGHSRLSNTEVGCRSKRHVRSVEAALTAHGHSYAVTNEDARLRRETRRADVHFPDDEWGTFDHGRYHSAAEIEAFMWHLADKHKKFVRLTVDDIKSRQGRNLTIMTIQSPSRIRKNSVWVDAGLHAREWISPAATLYFVEKLLHEFDHNLHDSVYTKVSWHIMPLANPDGYENSRSEGTAKKRYWRKNMSPPVASHPRCAGTDLNRNVGYPPEAYGIGASSDPCSDVYKGTEGDSEPETKVIVNAVKHLYDHWNLTSSIAVHSYGQKWLTSWGYTFEVPDDHDRLTRWGDRAVEAIKKVRGTDYKVGTASGGLYIAGGATDDYAKALGVDFVATVELGDTGTYGFVLPPQEIKPTGEELFEAMGVVAETAANPNKYS